MGRQDRILLGQEVTVLQGERRKQLQWGQDCRVRGRVGTVTVHKGHRRAHPVERCSSELGFELQKASLGCKDTEGLDDCVGGY